MEHLIKEAIGQRIARFEVFATTVYPATEPGTTARTVDVKVEHRLVIWLENGDMISMLLADPNIKYEAK